jgi:hypothetical protein
VTTSPTAPTASVRITDDHLRDRDRLLRMLLGFCDSKVLAVACELRLADQLAGGPRSAAELAGAVQADLPSLRRLLHTLACLGLLAEAGPDRYALAPLGEVLRSDVPGSVRELATMICGEAAWRTFGALDHSIRTGETAFRHVFGMGPFEYYHSEPELLRNFNAAMSDHTGFMAPYIATGFDFSRFRTLVDVGGGDGTMLAELLRTYPELTARMVETEAGGSAAAAKLAAAGVADRAEVVVGDFFRAVPAGADAYLVKSVLHDWSDDECRQILANCRAAGRPDSTVLVVEPLMPDRAGPEAAGVAMSDLNMLVNTGGRERSEADFAAVMAAAGFRLSYVSPPLGPVLGQTVIWSVPYHVLVGRPE